MIYIEDEERDRQVDAFINEAKAIGSMVEIAKGERDFRLNQYDRLAADALDLCLRIGTAFAPRQASNTLISGSDPPQQPLGGADRPTKPEKQNETKGTT